VVRLARTGLLASPIRRCDYVAATSLLWTEAEISSMTAASNAASIPNAGAVLAGAARANLSWPRLSRFRPRQFA
jgi:hypothetical protein